MKKQIDLLFVYKAVHRVRKIPPPSPKTIVNQLQNRPTSSPAHLFAIRERRKRGPGTLQTRD